MQVPTSRSGAAHMAETSVSKDTFTHAETVTDADTDTDADTQP